MKLMILCPQWGHEHMEMEAFFNKIKEAGYDGIDTWVPQEQRERRRMSRLLQEYGLIMVSHQHQAAGRNIKEFCTSFEYYLNLSAETAPVLINSHSGRDFFSQDDQLRVLDTAAEFEQKHQIKVAHETHRGRMFFCPENFRRLLAERNGLRITADLSHWVCVTESYLENFTHILDSAIDHSVHIHARVGFPQGPQVPDPRESPWSDSTRYFLNWWQAIAKQQLQQKAPQLTITTEFGPPPYMWTTLKENVPVASQWEVNLYMKQLLKESL